MMTTYKFTAWNSIDAKICIDFLDKFNFDKHALCI